MAVGWPLQPKVNIEIVFEKILLKNLTQIKKEMYKSKYMVVMTMVMVILLTGNHLLLDASPLGLPYPGTVLTLTIIIIIIIIIIIVICHHHRCQYDHYSLTDQV